LHAAVYGDKPIPIHYFPRKRHALTLSVMLATVLFICFSITANMAAMRIASIDLSWIPLIGRLGLKFPAGTVLFPATYALSTILTEVYGYSISRLVIWCGLGANLVLVAALFLVSSLPASSSWDTHNTLNEQAYHLFIVSYARTFFASALAYFCSEFVNTMALAKMKVASQGHHAALRIMASTMLAVSLDSIIFCMIVFAGRLSALEIAYVIAGLIIVKVTYELVFLPIVLAVSRYLKVHDHIDYYDFDTNFNPFIVTG
jgi:queuosine precursor transporter